MLTCGYFRLHPQYVALFYGGGFKSFVIQQLPPARLVMEFVAHQLAVGAVPGKIHFFHKQDKNAVNRDILGEICGYFLVACGIPYFNSDVFLLLHIQIPPTFYI